MLDAEAMLGAMIDDITGGKPGGSQARTTGGKMAGAKPVLPAGITKKESHFVQEIHRYTIDTKKQLDRYIFNVYTMIATYQESF